MYYIINRGTSDEVLEGTILTIDIQGNKFDVIQSSKNTMLYNISDYVIDDSNVLIKSAMINESDIKKELEKSGIKLNTMIYGM